jgi:hypothetical protein
LPGQHPPKAAQEVARASLKQAQLQRLAGLPLLGVQALMLVLKPAQAKAKAPPQVLQEQG